MPFVLDSKDRESDLDKYAKAELSLAGIADTEDPLVLAAFKVDFEAFQNTNEFVEAASEWAREQGWREPE